VPDPDPPKPDLSRPDLSKHALSKHALQKKAGSLAKSAESRLNELLLYDQLKKEQWLMRLSVNGQARSWERLTSDTARNDAMIKERIAGSDKPVTELVLGFAGMVEWRGNRRFMVYLQYFESDCDQGVLCLRHLKEGLPDDTFEAFGGFMIAGVCKNIWI
jgi:hypothetical protein